MCDDIIQLLPKCETTALSCERAEPEDLASLLVPYNTIDSLAETVMLFHPIDLMTLTVLLQIWRSCLLWRLIFLTGLV